MARPKKPIDIDQLKKIAERGWNDDEIGAFFNATGQTVRRRFGPIIDSHRLNGKAKLKDIIWQRAIGKGGNDKGSDRVLIHLADRVLGPVKQEVEQAHQGKIEIVITDYRSKKE